MESEHPLSIAGTVKNEDTRIPGRGTNRVLRAAPNAVVAVVTTLRKDGQRMTNDR